MNVVGFDDATRDLMQVHTIDVWFSQRRNLWIVDRLNADGHHVGVVFVSMDEAEAKDCAAHWLRAHTETYLLSPWPMLSIVKRAVRQSRRAA